MDEKLELVHEHMISLGGDVLAHANWLANFSPSENEHWPQLSVLQAAHAAEMFLKARIAQEDPLLLFEQLSPLNTQESEAVLSFEYLLEQGRTVRYSELPDRLWKVARVRLDRADLFEQFSHLRNAIQHFSSPHGCDFSQRTNEFIYGVVDPFINQCWGLFAVDFCDDSAGSEYLTLIAKSSKHENAKQPHWAQARSSCWGTRSPPL